MCATSASSVASSFEVVDGNGRDVNNVGLLPGGVMAGGEQAKESLCFESQVTYA